MCNRENIWHMLSFGEPRQIDNLTSRQRVEAIHLNRLLCRCIAYIDSPCLIHRFPHRNAFFQQNQPFGIIVDWMSSDWLTLYPRLSHFDVMEHDYQSLFS